MTEHEAEAARLGAVAYHQGKTIGDCPYHDGDPMRNYWTDRWTEVSKGQDRLDMAPIRARGWRAFHDGVARAECPWRRDNPNAAQWRVGWDDAERTKHDEIAKRYL
jgi:hypothetical protein